MQSFFVPKKAERQRRRQALHKGSSVPTVEEVAAATATRRNGGQQGRPWRTEFPCKLQGLSRAARQAAEISVRTTSPRRYGVIPQGLEVYRLGAVRGVAYWTHPPSRTCTVDTAPYGGARFSLQRENHTPKHSPPLARRAKEQRTNNHQKVFFFVRRRRRRGGYKGGEEEVPPCCSSSPPLLVQPARKQEEKIGKRRRKRWKLSKARAPCESRSLF